MRRIALILLPIVVGLPGCRKAETIGSKPLPVLPVTSTSTPSAPEWIDNVPPGSAFGVEPPNPMGDIDLQRTAATAKARTRLAFDIEDRLRSIFHYLSQNSATLAEKLQSPSGQTVQEGTSRQLADITLHGTQARRFWTDPKTGYVWVLVVSDPTLQQNALRETVRQGLVDLGLGQAALQEAEDRMDAALAATQKHPQ